MIEPFRIEVPDADLDDLRERLRRTRWPAALDDPEWAYGIEQGYLRELAHEWAESYDWRAHEADLNRWPQWKTEIDGQSFHFIHARSEVEGATPLILVHGWPGSIVEFRHILGPLTDPEAHGGRAEDAFHVVAPSLPGYGFSTPYDARGWHVGRTGRAFAALMERLGYDRYFAQGGDWGSMVSQAIAAHDAEHCAAIHLNYLFTTPPDAEALEKMTPLEADGWARFNHYMQEDSGYSQQQATRPETLGYGLTDSPVGQLAWIAEKFREWTDCGGVIENAVSREDLLTNVTLYWVTRTAASSARFYRETRLAESFTPKDYLATPVGHAAYPKEIMAAARSWLEARYNVTHWTDMPQGGHFAALEQPEGLVTDIRTFFRNYR